TPITLMQSGRFAVSSMSSTVSSPWGSMLSTGSPRPCSRSTSVSMGTSASTYSRSHSREMRIAPSDPSQKPDVVLVKQPDVVDPVLQHRRALDADAEREGGVPFGVDPGHLQGGRMEHAAPEDLQPAGALARRAALPPADQTGDRHFCARLGEGAVGRREPHPHLRPP